jgi:hypothetical protein
MQTFDQLISGELTGSIRLKLSCGLTELPNEIFNLADTLEILDLSGNKLSWLPHNFGQLRKLRIVFFSDNLFTEFPEVLSQCEHLEMIGFKANSISHIPPNAFPPKLRWLILTNNHIETIPPSIGDCIYLQKVMLAGNRLSHLPIEMSACRNIELLRISANQFTSLPDWLLSLPRLSWLAFNGNPFSKKTFAENNITIFPWEDLNLEDVLGEGASGIISRAYSQSMNRSVAIKIFKGDVTSDGLPSDEMNASIHAALHPNLVKVLGKIQNHPQQKQGLVFELIPSGYINLGGPPSFSSCTRDVFEEHVSFSINQIITIVAGIASAVAQLHAKGINHGDLYAHNVLIDSNAEPLLSDFGAASFYDTQSPESSAIERIEVRALGCLLEDLLNRIDDSGRNYSVTKTLLGLTNDCMQEGVTLRPSFQEIDVMLSNIKSEYTS